MKTRREFLKTVAAGSAVAIAAVATQSAAATVVKTVAGSAKRPAPKIAPYKGAAPVAQAARAAGAHRMDPAELAKQKKYTADALKVIRDYVLAAGSPMAFSFKPLKAARGPRTR